MKTDTRSRKPQVVSESRKIRKPLMEKKRRARINDSLETLKHILLESKTNLKTASRGGQRSAKLEKADILEMTVRYLQQLHGKIKKESAGDDLENTAANTNKENSPTTGCNFSKRSVTSTRKSEVIVRPADSSCDSIKMQVSLLPAISSPGKVVYFLPNKIVQSYFQSEKCAESSSGSLWRPW